MSIGALGYLAAAAGYGLLTLLLLVSWRRRRLTTLLLSAAGATLAWSLASLALELDTAPLWLQQLTELARDLAWCLFLFRVLALQAEHTGDNGRGIRRWQKLLLLLGLASGLLLALSAVPGGDLAALLPVETPLVIWLGFSVAGLLLIEQIYRNAGREERWALKYLCLGLGALFAFDFYLYAEALLFRRIDASLWQARGFVAVLAVPLIAIAAARNESWTRGLHVSRQVVFHSFTLLAAGLYLLVMASAGFFIKYHGGSWGGVLQVAFFVASGLLLVALLFSDTLRARLRVFLGKHFFSYKYDYRAEWNRFTHTLSSGDGNIPERVVRALAALVHARGGLLWLQTNQGDYELAGEWVLSAPEGLPPIPAGDPLVDFLAESGWILDLEEYRQTPNLYDGLELPSWAGALPDAWLVVPLVFRESLIGLLVLGHSEVQKSLNWEDRDLLKMAGKQAAVHLAQHQADEALMQARQFEAFNRLSAYIAHDLKNILAQQSLIVANAERHKHNPAFVDDVIETVRNSVERMTRLMAQMRQGTRGGHREVFDLNQILQEVADRRSSHRPVPELALPDVPLCVEADREQLATVFGHLVQNAQEATPDDGQVRIRLSAAEGQAIIEVEDTGVGMDPGFISERLFKPFDSTKGLTGMGIGMFESRETLRTLGGEIEVESEPGKGSRFRVILPTHPCGTRAS